MILAARQGFSGSTFAATSIELYPSTRVSKIGVISRMMRSSSRRLVRVRTSSSGMSARAATWANGRSAIGKLPCSKFRSLRSSSSSGTADPSFRLRTFAIG
jgi:hypothetical protein